MEDTAFSEVDISQLLRTVPGSGVLSCNYATTQRWLESA